MRRSSLRSLYTLILLTVYGGLLLLVLLWIAGASRFVVERAADSRRGKSQPSRGEPGHTFVLIDEAGEVDWLQDYGALENGGVMYVLPHEVVRQVRGHL